MLKNVCYFHRPDFDGQCSGALVRIALKGDVKLIPINYSDDYNFDEIDENTDVYVVDYAFPIKDMMELKKISRRLIWIDHHISSIRESQELNFKTEGLLDNNFSACQLCWDYFFKEEHIKKNPGKPNRPKFIDLIGFYDIWKHDEETIPFNLGLKLYDTIPTAKIWDTLWEARHGVDLVYSIISKGKVIEKYEKILNAKTCSAACLPTTLDGYKAIALNKPVCNSLTFDSVWDENKYDIEIVYYRHRSGQWLISLYCPNNKVDVSVIAKKYGGGGHKSAAGFKCKDLPFPI